MLRKCLLFWMGTVCLCLLSSQAASDQRGIHVGPQGAPDAESHWALVIGIDDYQYWPKLTTAANDAKEVGRILIERYGFLKEQVITLLNEDATRLNILSALRGIGKKVRKHKDDLFIYYAGHGELDELLDTGYWVPVDARQREVGDFLDNAVIRNYISGIDTLHTFLVADSCFAGSLFIRGPTPRPPEKTDVQYFDRVNKLRSRQGLTSGNIEPVADLGFEGHSIFAYYFLKALKENQDPYLVPSTIFERIKIPVARNSQQLPVFKPLRDAKDEGGEFVFVLAKALPQVSPGMAQPAVPPSVKEVSELDAKIRSLEEERKRLQAEREILEDKQRLFDERKRLEEERSKLEEERRRREQSQSVEQAKLDEERRKLEALRKEIEAQRASLHQETSRREEERPAQAAEPPPMPPPDEERPAKTAQPPPMPPPDKVARLHPLKPLPATEGKGIQRREDGAILDPVSGVMWMELPRLLTYSEAFQEAQNLNRSGPSGAAEWHVPSRDEAIGLLASRRGGAGGPLNSLQGTFWINEVEQRSASGLGAVENYCTYLDLGAGEFFKSNETRYPQAHKLLVASKIPESHKPSAAGRFVDQGDHTIMDGQTGLIWQKQPSPESLFYEDALAYVKHLNDTRSGGVADWRLPTVKELQGLVRSKSEEETALPKPFDCSVSEVWTGDQDFSVGGLNVMYVMDIQTGFPHRMLTEPPPDDDSVYLPRHRPKHVLAVRKDG